jgi:hypothetical protein
VPVSRDTCDPNLGGSELGSVRRVVMLALMAQLTSTTEHDVGPELSVLHAVLDI